MSKVTVEVKGYQMRCGYCGVMKDYPAEFPNSMYAQCEDCWVKEFAKHRPYRFTLKDMTEYLVRLYWDAWVWIVVHSCLVRMWFIQHVVCRRKRKPALDAMMKDAFTLLEEDRDE